jgi:polar amino acid transport system permease protein
MHLDFGPVLEYWPLLLRGGLVTIVITAIGAALGTLVGILCAWGRAFGPRPVASLVAIYVELIRNTPFLVQLYFIYFGLSSAGIRLTAVEGAVLAMVINLGAYSTEIVRAGIQATPKGQFEAGASLGMSGVQVFVYVVIIPALRKVWPAITSQIVIVMLGSAVVSQISAEDLSFAANYIQSRNFLTVESYIVATVGYIIIASLFRATSILVARLLFRGM